MKSKKALFLIIGAVFVFTALASGPVVAGDNKTLTVMALVYVKSGFEAQVKEELLKLVPLTHLEPGCLQYDMHVNVDLETLKENPKAYLFYENWRSREDWDLHMKMPYLKNWFDMAPNVTEKIELTIWEMQELPCNPTFRGGAAPDPKEKFTLMAQVYIKPGLEDTALKEMMSLVPLTHLEPGCINYDMHVNLDMDTMAKNPKNVMFYENWYNYKVWKVDHMEASYLVRWFDMAPKLTDKIDLTGWRMMHFSENYEDVQWSAK